MARMKLQPRERMVLTVGAVAVVAIGLFWLIDGPYQAYADSKVRVVEARQRLLDAQIKQAEVTKANERDRQIRQKLGQHGAGFDLWTEIDKAVKDLKLNTRTQMRSVRGMSSRGENNAAVEVTMNGVSTQELVNFLHRVYDTDYIVLLSQLTYLKPSVDKKGLDCRMTLVAPRA